MQDGHGIVPFFCQTAKTDTNRVFPLTLQNRKPDKKKCKPKLRQIISFFVIVVLSKIRGGTEYGYVRKKSLKKNIRHAFWRKYGGGDAVLKF